MTRFSKFALVAGLASAAAGLPSLTAQTGPNDQDKPGDVAAAIRFQKAEEAAAARQARIEAARQGVPTPVTRAAPRKDLDEPGDVAAAIRFQNAEDAAAARQARMDELNNKSRTSRRMSATARTTQPQQ